MRFGGDCVATRNVSNEGRVPVATVVDVDGALCEGTRDTVEAAVWRYHWSFGGGGGGFWDANLLKILRVESLESGFPLYPSMVLVILDGQLSRTVRARCAQRRGGEGREEENGREQPWLATRRTSPREQITHLGWHEHKSGKLQHLFINMADDWRAGQ